MMIVAKFNNKIVQIVRVQKQVGFSEEQDWIFVCFDFEKINRKREHFKWVPATTRFDWVREFSFE
jgi:hypothetical protein